MTRMPTQKRFYNMTRMMCLLLAFNMATNMTLAGKHHTSDSNQKLVNPGRRHYYETIDSSSIRPNGECLNSSGDINNCESRRTPLPQKPVDKPFQMDYRLRQIDRMFEENHVASSDLEATGADTTLRQVLLLHRHGDRTPVQFADEDPLGMEPFWTFHGLGQLTNRGKARLYMLGQMMRTRYNKFLNSRVNKNERITRSSGTLRCIESAQCFLSSFLGLNQSTSRDAPLLVWDRRTNILAHLWQPVNVQSVPAKLDAMLAESAECAGLTEEWELIEKSVEAQSLYEDYKNEMNTLATLTGFNVTRFYMWSWAASLIEVEKTYFPDKIQPGLLEIYDRLQQAGTKAMGLYAGTIKARRLRSGVLIGNMIENMLQFRDSGDKPDSKVKKFLHYSAHDLTLVTMLNILDVWKKIDSHPDYGSNLVLELHFDDFNKEWFVRFFYMSPVPSKPIALHLPHCESDHPKSRCTLDKFREIMQPYSIPSWQDWMRECGNDFSQLDPYAAAT